MKITVAESNLDMGHLIALTQNILVKTHIVARDNTVMAMPITSDPGQNDPFIKYIYMNLLQQVCF